MKIVFFTSILCIIVGLGLIIGGGVAIPIVNSIINDVQAKAASYLSQASDAITSAINAINNTRVTLVYLNSAVNFSLPDLSSSSQLTSNIASNLTAIGSTVRTVGQSLGGISVAGTSPFNSVGNVLASVGDPIETAANTLQSVSDRINSIREQTSDLPNRLETITVQLDDVKASLTSLKSSIGELQDSLAGYFDTIRLVAILAIAGVMGLGLIFLMIGISLLSLRHKSIEHAAAIYRMYAKDPSLNK
jgi:peptidoglycan hydrolase CwlO-like protein